MDLEKFLKSVGKSRSEINIKVDGIRRVFLKENEKRRNENEHASFKQLLAKHTPQPSPLIEVADPYLVKASFFRVFQQLIKKKLKMCINVWKNDLSPFPQKATIQKNNEIIFHSNKATLFKSNTLKTIKNSTSPILNEKKNKIINDNKRSNISKLESVIKLARFLIKIRYSQKKIIFSIYSLIKISEKFQKKLGVIIFSRFSDFFLSLSHILHQNPKKKLSTSTHSISITPRNFKKTETFSMIKENSLSLVPPLNKAFPNSNNNRYLTNKHSESNILRFEISPKVSIHLPNYSELNSLEIENSENLSNNSEKNILLDYSNLESCDEELKFNDDDSIVELENKAITIESEISPILSPKLIKYGENFKNFEKGTFKSTSTMCIATKNVINQKILRYSKEDTIDEMPFCGKSEEFLDVWEDPKKNQGAFLKITEKNKKLMGTTDKTPKKIRLIAKKQSKNESLNKFLALIESFYANNLKKYGFHLMKISTSRMAH